MDSQETAMKTGSARRSLTGRLLILLGIALLGLGVWAASTPPTRTLSASEAWSKGALIGTASLVEPPAITIQDGKLAAAWVDPAKRFRLARFDLNGNLQQEQMLEVATRVPYNLRLLPEPGGGLVLLWADRLIHDGPQQLHYVRLDAQGRVVGGARSASLPGGALRDFQAVWVGSGAPLLLIVAGGEEGLYRLLLTPGQERGGAPALLVPDGESAFLQQDETGSLHLTWRQRDGGQGYRFFYAPYALAEEELQDVVELSSVFKGDGQTLDGPLMALDISHAYVLWSLYDRRDGTSRSWYVSLPLADPQAVSDAARVPSGGIFVRDLMPLACQRSQALVAASIREESSPYQLAVMVFERGAYVGYQPVSASRTSSLKGAPIADPAGNMHLLWLDSAGFDRYQVVYASTAEAAKAALGRLTVRDVADALLGRILNLGLVVGAAPLIIAWGLVSLLWLLVRFLVTWQDELETRGDWLALGVAVLLQTAMMMVIVPGAVGGAGLMRYGLPILLAAVGLGAVYVYLRLADRASLFFAFIVFSATHGLVRLGVYALSL